MIKISSKDIQEASKTFQTFLKKVVASYKRTDVYEPDDILLAKKYGFDYLGSGVYRVAYRYKNIVVKTHLSVDAIEDITTEHELWKHYAPSLSSSILNPVLFCKTLHYSNCTVSYSISPLVKTHRGSNKIEKHKNYNKFLRLVKNSIYDGHTGNIGILNKLPILIDYQDGSVEFNQSKLDIKDIRLFKKQRLSILSLVKKATA